MRGSAVVAERSSSPRFQISEVLTCPFGKPLIWNAVITAGRGILAVPKSSRSGPCNVDGTTSPSVRDMHASLQNWR